MVARYLFQSSDLRGRKTGGAAGEEEEVVGVGVGVERLEDEGMEPSIMNGSWRQDYHT
jgi:hypothetical protein